MIHVIATIELNKGCQENFEALHEHVKAPHMATYCDTLKDLA